MTAMTNSANAYVSFDEYKAAWISEIAEGNRSTVALGHLFAKKLITEWTEYTESSENDITFCDGAGDGGIDVAYLQRGDNSEDSGIDGDTWFIVQSKYGTAFQGRETLLTEAQKMIDTLDGKNPSLSTPVKGIVEKIGEFRNKAGDKDKLTLVFATVDPLSDDERRALEDVKAMGQRRFGNIFDVDNVSIKTIFDRNADEVSQKYTLPFTANLVQSGKDLLVGSVTLYNLYQFLKSYKQTIGDLDLLYERNVRNFLGANKKVNKGIAETLKTTPELFGLFNNGITIVVEEWEKPAGVERQYNLTEPYVVNGCQTTRTIWDTLEKKMESGGTGKEPDGYEVWKQGILNGIVVVKVVKTGDSGEQLLNETTKYTNSQNAVSAKDFLALESDFKNWAKEMERKYNLFLEIKRGGWESRKAYQNKNPSTKQFSAWINAFELIKVYASAWLNEPGLAFGSNVPFVPGGKLFKKITEDKDINFGIDDLFAAYCLYKTAEKTNPTRPAKNPKRSRYLYYWEVIELLRRIMRASTGLETSNNDISAAVIKLFNPNKPPSEAAHLLLETASLLDDDYFNDKEDDCIFKEEKFQVKKDLNGHLKTFSASKENSPLLHKLISAKWDNLRRKSQGQPQSDCDTIAAELVRTTDTFTI